MRSSQRWASATLSACSCQLTQRNCSCTEQHLHVCGGVKGQGQGGIAALCYAAGRARKPSSLVCCQHHPDKHGGSLHCTCRCSAGTEQCMPLPVQCMPLAFPLRLPPPCSHPLYCATRRMIFSSSCRPAPPFAPPPCLPPAGLPLRRRMCRPTCMSGSTSSLATSRQAQQLWRRTTCFTT